MHNFKLLLLVLVGAIFAQHASAITITFGELDEYVASTNLYAYEPYYENGAVVTPEGGYLSGPNPYGSGTHDYAYMVNAYWDYAKALNVSLESGGTFSADSVDIMPVIGQPYLEFWLYDDALGFKEVFKRADIPFDNVSIKGYRDNVEVASSEFWMEDIEAQNLDSTFSNIDMLSISMIFPDYTGTLAPYLAEYEKQGYEVLYSHMYCEGDPCGIIGVDNIVLTPVPLPGSLILMATAIGLFGIRRFTIRK